jgi:S-adenosylmethionine uptake transporter
VARPIEIAFFMSLIMTSGFLLAAPFLAVPPPAAELPAIAGAAILAFVSLILLSWAYARAEAQYLAPVEYSAFIWASLFGFLIFAEPVQPLTLVGAAMIVVACLLAARRTRVADASTGV